MIHGLFYSLSVSHNGSRMGRKKMMEWIEKDRMKERENDGMKLTKFKNERTV